MASCGSTGFVDRRPASLHLTPAPAELTEECDYAMLIPNGTPTQAQAEAIMRHDRRALKECREEKAAVVQFYRLRDDGLSKRE
jgi:hypothetical protein